MGLSMLLIIRRRGFAEASRAQRETEKMPVILSGANGSLRRPTAE